MPIRRCATPCSRGHRRRLRAGPRVRVRRSAWNTTHPLARIVWEQLAQPLALARAQPDLAHQLAFVAPVLSRAPFVLTV